MEGTKLSWGVVISRTLSEQKVERDKRCVVLMCFVHFFCVFLFAIYITRSLRACLVYPSPLLPCISISLFLRLQSLQRLPPFDHSLLLLRRRGLPIMYRLSQPYQIQLCL